MIHPEQFELSNASEHASNYLDALANRHLANYVFDREISILSAFTNKSCLWKNNYITSQFQLSTIRRKRRADLQVLTNRTVLQTSLKPAFDFLNKI